MTPSISHSEKTVSTRLHPGGLVRSTLQVIKRDQLITWKIISFCTENDIYEKVKEAISVDLLMNGSTWIMLILKLIKLNKVAKRRGEKVKLVERPKQIENRPHSNFKANSHYFVLILCSTYLRS